MAPRTIFNTESVSILLKHCREVLGQLEGAKGAFVWLVDTWGQGGDEDQVNNWSLHILTSKQVIGVAAQQFRDFLHVFSAAALQSLLVVLCGGAPHMVDTMRQSLEDLSQDVDQPQQYQTSLGFTVLHCRQGAEVFCL